MAAVRKIIHVDMDAFYASVAQRDQPELRGQPVVVAWLGPRSVVCAASYEARAFGVHSAMPALRAQRLCPQAIFVPPDFERYRTISRQVRAVLLRHSALVEPLSLDEAYIDVSDSTQPATEIAARIRAQIAAQTGLTASAGVSCNKFLAKIASDWRKPNGLFVIRPRHVPEFLHALPVKRIPGVGRVTQERMAKLGIATVGQLRQLDVAVLEQQFGRRGVRLHQLAHGIDHSPVQPRRPTRSVSAEDTFAQDQLLPTLASVIRALAHKAWENSLKTPRSARTVTLKLRTADFRTLTRSCTPATAIASANELATLALELCARVHLPATTRYRLAGVGLSNFEDGDMPPQASLFGSPCNG